MLELIVEKVKLEYGSFKEEISKINQGYRFGRYLANDIRQRTKLVANEMSNNLNEITIVLQLGEYQLALEDVRIGNANPYSLGVVLYSISHRKDNKMMNDFWNYLNDNISNSNTLVE